MEAQTLPGITPEEWAEMLEWLRPRLSVGAFDGAVGAARWVEIMLERLDAVQLTEFTAEWLVADLKRISKTPASFRQNIAALIRHRQGKEPPRWPGPGVMELPT